MIRFAPPFLLIALLGAEAAAQDGLLDQDRVDRPALGFRVTRPDAGWCFKDQKSALPEGLLARLILAPKATGAPAAYVNIDVREGQALAADELASMTARSLKSQGKTLTRGRGSIAAIEAPFLVTDFEGPGGQRYRARVLFVVREGLTYQFSCAARPEEFKQRQAVFDRILAAFRWTPRKRSAADRAKARLAALGRRCGSELSWAENWEQAARRARSEKRLVLAVYSYYAGFAIPERTLVGPFMDPDLIALVESRFVPLKMNSATPAPFRRPEVYGLSQSSFGTAYIVTNPEGAVLAETGGFDAAYLYEFLRAALPEAPPPSGEALDTAAEALRRGQLRLAEARLAGQSSVRALRLRAALHRRRREGPEALAALAEAERRASDPATKLEIAADRALINMRSGRLVEAEAGFAALAVLEHPRRPEALYWLGALQVLRGASTSTYASWRSLVTAFPESRWAWKAAAEMSGQGSFTSGSERLRWPSPEAIASYRLPGSALLGVRQLDKVESEALSYLMKNQGGDGAWIYPPEALTPMGGINTDAISAVVGLALLRFPDRPGVSKALRALLDHLRELQGKGRLAYRYGRPVGAHAIWRRAFLLWFLAEGRRAKLLSERELQEMGAPLIEAIAREQAPSGGWPYISIPSSLRPPSADSSASFLAAGMIQALLAARESGLALPEGLLERALAFLERMRREDGRFRYMPAIKSKRSLAEAAGRGPVCALALFLGKKADAALLKRTLDLFLDHARPLTRELRKELGHTGPEGQGSHYFFYDYRFAAAALRHLPASDRSRYRRALLEDILEARCEDGSFVAMPKLGRSYGTAMALLAIADLRAR